MKSFMHLFVAITSILLITACGKTSSEQAKDNVDTAISDFKASASAVDALGTPNANWTDTQFAHYEATVRDCSAKADRVESLDGKDGVIVYGTWNLPTLRRLLASKLSLSSAARREKDVLEAARTQTAAFDGATARYQAHLTALQAAGTPTSDWTFEQLDRYEAHVLAIELEAHGITSILGYEPSTMTNALKSAKLIRENLQIIRLGKGAKPAA